MTFEDHGIVVTAVESRGVAVLRDSRGRFLVIACSNDKGVRGWILVTDVDTGNSTQVYFPENVENLPPYASLLSRNGRFYTGAGKVLLEYDPAAEKWSAAVIPQPDAFCFVGESLADGPGGLIFGGTCYNSHLFSFDPVTRNTVDYGRMDPVEKYFWYLAFDDEGWAYCGIGPARWNIVAFHPVTRERRQLIPENERQLGTGFVYRGVDGVIYGMTGDRWFRLSQGKAEPIEPRDVAARAHLGEIGWGTREGLLPDGREVRNYDLPNRQLEIVESNTGGTRKISLSYQAGGASITTLGAGLDGHIYGSSAHPMHFFSFDPDSRKLVDFGPHKEISGGNICAIDAQGPYLVCPAYSKGWFYLYDTRQPWNGGYAEPANPRLLAQYAKEICRPRAALAHPDGRHVLMAGYAGYGLCGGGLAIYDLETDQAELMDHEALVPNQSVVALKALPDGNLVGGSTIEAKGGGHATEKEGVLFLLDWASRKVVFRTAPVPGAEGIVSLEVGEEGDVYGVTAPGSELFVFNMISRRVMHRANLAEYGEPVRPALVKALDGSLYALFTKAILRIRPAPFQVEKLADTPGALSAGGALVGNRLFFAIKSHLWSCGL